MTVGAGGNGGFICHCLAATAGPSYPLILNLLKDGRMGGAGYYRLNSRSAL